MQWVDIFIKLWCFVYNGWIFIKLWCFICNGWKDWLNSDVLCAMGGKIDWDLMFICMWWKDWLNFDVLYARGGKIDWTLMFYMHWVDWTLMFYMHGVERLIELWCSVCMGWKDLLNFYVLYAWGGKIDWTLMFHMQGDGWTLMFYMQGVERLIEFWCSTYMHGVERLIELWCLCAWGGKIDWTLMFHMQEVFWSFLQFYHYLWKKVFKVF